MKTLLLFATVAMSAFACGSRLDSQAAIERTPMPAEVWLAGKVYSRTFTATPFGAPGPMQMTHSLKFREGGLVEDDGNTFFGNPPEVSRYVVRDGQVLVGENPTAGRTFKFNQDWSSLTNLETGAEFKLVQ